MQVSLFMAAAGLPHPVYVYVLTSVMQKVAERRRGLEVVAQSHPIVLDHETYM